MRPQILLMMTWLLGLNHGAKIELVRVNSEVYKGEYIHLQCLVEYEETEQLSSELSIDIYRSTDQGLEHLSSNGQLEIGNDQLFLESDLHFER